MNEILEAIEELLPFIHEDGMDGETPFERAVIKLEKAYRNKVANTRKVYIKKYKNTYFVLYLDRPYKGKYCAAQFDESVKNYKKVVEWVKSNPSLRLVTTNTPE